MNIGVQTVVGVCYIKKLRVVGTPTSVGDDHGGGYMMVTGYHEAS